MALEKREIKPDFLNGYPPLAALTPRPWLQYDWHGMIAARKNSGVDRLRLVEELMRQNAHLPQNSAVLQNIHALESPDAFTVTTGHQVCLLGGPMFTLYKIATTIAMAQDLTAKLPGHKVVPVLWMATEDHDWEEVNHFFAGFGDKRVYAAAVEGPVGRHALTPAILDVLPENMPAVVAECYAPGRTMAEAFRLLMHALFGQHGLVILDADRPVLKAQFAHVMRRELQGFGIAQAVRSRTEELEALGYKAQIFPRDINLFYIGDGKRTLLDRSDDTIVTKGGAHSWSLPEIEAEMRAHPENFSPNVALRPLYQESILPNLAYVGGWAEVSYWLQLGLGFAQAGVPYPVLVPRLHATLFTQAQAQAFTALGLELRHIAEPQHVLNDRLLDSQWDEGPIVENMAGVKAAYEALAENLAPLDPTLATGVRADLARATNALDDLRKKLRKAMRNRNPEPYKALAALKQAIEPENQPQQRTLNFLAFDSVDPVILAEILVQSAKWDQPTTQWITLP